MDSQTNSSKTLIDVYQIVTDRIVSLLEAGTVPWQQPWTNAGIPMNLLSKRQYRGINLWLLLTLNYERNLFLTWQQLKNIGGSVHQGEHGHIVLFWKNVKKKPEERDAEGNIKTVPMLRYYKVFNVSQCRDIPESYVPMASMIEHQPLIECEQVIQGMPSCPTIKHKEQKAYYHKVDDFINMPKKKSFVSGESYFQTLFHELVHSTGSEKRLNRSTITEMAEFGSDPYSLEELIAEIGAAYLCSHTGIFEHRIEDSAAYIKGWLDQLKNDKRFIVQASGYAQKAVDFILNRQEEGSTKEVNESIEESVVS